MGSKIVDFTDRERTAQYFTVATLCAVLLIAALGSRNTRATFLDDSTLFVGKAFVANVLAPRTGAADEPLPRRVATILANATAVKARLARVGTLAPPSGLPRTGTDGGGRWAAGARETDLASPSFLVSGAVQPAILTNGLAVAGAEGGSSPIAVALGAWNVPNFTAGGQPAAVADGPPVQTPTTPAVTPFPEPTPAPNAPPGSPLPGPTPAPATPPGSPLPEPTPAPTIPPGSPATGPTTGPATLPGARLTEPPPAPPVTTVPEPTTWAMLLSGFAAIGGALRRGRVRRPIGLQPGLA